MCRLFVQVSRNFPDPIMSLLPFRPSIRSQFDYPEVTLKAIGSIEVTCCACTKQGLLKYHKAHFDSKCECTHFKPVPLRPSDLLIRPQEMSLTPLEEKLQSSFIKRSMHHSQTLVVKTRGQVGTKLLLLLLLCRT